jgi:hypothetical protein
MPSEKQESTFGLIGKSERDRAQEQNEAEVTDETGDGKEEQD